MDREWIYIQGRKLLWREFIDSLDYYRGCEVLSKKGTKTCEQYIFMAYALQEITDDYHRGRTWMEDGYEVFLKNYGMHLPTERKLPEALDELFSQLQALLGVDLTELPESCAQKTERVHCRIQERTASVRSLMQKHGISEGRDGQDSEEQIRNILMLQKAKRDSPDYELEEREIHAAALWCELLMSEMFSETITRGQMLRLVQLRLAEERELSDLLKNNYGRMEDYEWYSESLLCCGLDDCTVIKTSDILALCAPRLEEILGMKEGALSYYYFC